MEDQTVKKIIITILVIVGILPASSFAGVSKIVKSNLIKLENNDSPSDGCGVTHECGHTNGGGQNIK